MADESVIDTSIQSIEEDNSDDNLDLDCEGMLQALAFYDKIVQRTDSKELKKRIKTDIRVNALAIVKIVSSQNTYIAPMEGRIQAMEKNILESNSTQQALITELLVARELDKKVSRCIGNCY
ncbi:hypothetical protein CDAR_443141 [Caerostris darwini]|uniref:Uncharacterized protein n=1 Tax=Caerostris darwini TaxID=1538125 RepID=A0AAV4MXC6_9ARAC|nr:hypothetical protein CDAR_443141 [Caerostris darwini]